MGHLVTYVLEHVCGDACERDGDRVEYRPMVNGGIEIGTIPRCVDTGNELKVLERTVV